MQSSVAQAACSDGMAATGLGEIWLYTDGKSLMPNANQTSLEIRRISSIYPFSTANQGGAAGKSRKVKKAANDTIEKAAT